jgi:hypothetical protein
MTDISNTVNVTLDRAGADAAVLSIAGTALLVLFFAIVALLPFDGAPSPDAIPTFFGP